MKFQKILMAMALAVCLTACGKSNETTYSNGVNYEDSDITFSDTAAQENETNEETSDDGDSDGNTIIQTEPANDVSETDKTNVCYELIEIEPQCKPSMGFSFELPTYWTYEEVQSDDIPTSEISVSIKPGDTDLDGRITIEYVNGGLGVCGTGLERKAIDFGGYTATQGFYDGNKVWSFIMLDDDYWGCAILNSAEWYDSYADIIDHILSTVEFKYYE